MGDDAVTHETESDTVHNEDEEPADEGGSFQSGSEELKTKPLDNPGEVEVDVREGGGCRNGGCDAPRKEPPPKGSSSGATPTVPPKPFTQQAEGDPEQGAAFQALGC